MVSFETMAERRHSGRTNPHTVGKNASGSPPPHKPNLSQEGKQTMTPIKNTDVDGPFYKSANLKNFLSHRAKSHFALVQLKKIDPTPLLTDLMKKEMAQACKLQTYAVI